MPNHRDPFGRPFIISFDLDYDDKIADTLYREQTVSAMGPTTNPGYAGHSFNSTRGWFEAQQGVMVWSLGPDNSAEVAPNRAGFAADYPGARIEPNKDNILGWQQ